VHLLVQRALSRLLNVSPPKIGVVVLSGGPSAHALSILPELALTQALWLNSCDVLRRGLCPKCSSYAS